MKKSYAAGLMVTAVAAIASHASATINLVGANPSVSQNFDSINSTSWSNNATVAGWELYRQPAGGPVAITSIALGSPTGNAGTFYAFGTGDRALGGVGSGGTYFGSPSTGTVAGWIAVGLSNTTDLTIDSFTLEYDGEQWRNGGNTSAQTMTLQYGFGNSFSSVSSWTTPGGAFNFVSPTVGSTAGALDGNAGANRVADLGGTISGLTWEDGSNLWIRWIENNDSGNDHGLGIDNFSFTATTVPEPATLVLLGLGGLALGRRVR